MARIVLPVCAESAVKPHSVVSSRLHTILSVCN